MKLLVLLLGATGLFAQGHAGNFEIRLEPMAVLQANAEIPFEIHVVDDRHKPLTGAVVTLQIETPEHNQVQVFKAAGTEAGVYMAKPVFPAGGQWSVYVEVHRSNAMSARTIDYNVPDSVRP